MQTHGFGGKHVISTLLTTTFNFFKSYFLTSLSLPIVRLVHSSPTVMYQENLQHEKAGLDVILYFCSYHGEKKINWAVFPYFNLEQCMGIPTQSRGQASSITFKLSQNWNNPSLMPSRYSHKSNLCKATFTTSCNTSWLVPGSVQKPKARHPRDTGTAFGSNLKGTTEHGSTPRVTIVGSATRIEGPSRNVNRCQTNKPQLCRSQDPGFSTGVIKANSTLKA